MAQLWDQLVVNARYSVAALAVGLPGIGLQAAAFSAARSLATGEALWKPLAWMDPMYLAFAGDLLGTALLVVALGLYAKAKGQSVFLGLLAVLSCIGLLVVAILPDKTKGRAGGG